MEELIETIKLCKICGVELNNNNTPRYQQNICKSCRNKLNNERYRKTHKRKIKAYHKIYYKKKHQIIMETKYNSLIPISSINKLENYINKEVYLEYITSSKKIKIYHGIIIYIKKRVYLETPHKTYRFLKENIKAIGEVKKNEE